MKKIPFLFMLGWWLTLPATGKTLYESSPATSAYITHQSNPGDFRIVDHARTASIYVDADDWKAVVRAAQDLGDDVRKVSGVASEIKKTGELPAGTGHIIVGTIGKSRMIDRMIADSKLDVTPVREKWESFLLETVDGNLVIAGSDKRGTIYGIYDLSEKMGVSPWYWWADVPVKRNSAVYVKAGRYVQEPPKVKYRGIFINDEEPSFGEWARQKFGGINSPMYATLFELLLRLKANYFWPAMWGKAFNEDDPLNPVVADEYGIVMGTSHHEPMMRAHKEYTKRRDTVGPWNYAANKENLDKFFTEGVERNKAFDNLITIGMRGDGDVAMSEEGDKENMKILHDVIDGQRGIIAQVYGKPASEVPQTWAIFTEVQRYYDKGFSVPDDVLLMFCDNNWGYIRRTGPDKEKEKKGGMGLYYHIDMNGGPWNDRWINTTSLPKLREQFNLAYQTGLDDLWIVNVGDLKPKELPIDFILRYAWNPDAIPADKVWDYTVDWAIRMFGKEHAEEIADIVSKYGKYNLWRKPEVQSPTLFSVVNHQEADRVTRMWREIADKAERLRSEIAPEAQDAYYQLVLYPAKASAGVAEIYLAAAKNNLYAKQGRASANDYASRANELFETDKQLSDYYNNLLSGGKWKSMMSDKHIGYVKWSMPKDNVLPPLETIVPLTTPALGVAVEGDEAAWPGENKEAQLPTFDVLDNPTYHIDVFNRGIGTLRYEAAASQPWVKLSQTQGETNKDTQIAVSIDWSLAPEGETKALIQIKANDVNVPVSVKAVKSALPRSEHPFFGSLTGKEFSIPAHQYNANVPGKQAKWTVLPDLGRSEACMGILPVTAPSAPTKDAPRLEYQVLLPEEGKATVCLGILPTQDVNPERGLRIAVALDNGKPYVIDARKGFVDTFGEYTKENIANSPNLKPLPAPNKTLQLINKGAFRNEVFDNLRWLDVEIDVKKAGIHTLKVYMVDPEVVLERIIINPDNEHPSYFGTPEKRHAPTI